AGLARAAGSGADGAADEPGPLDRGGRRDAVVGPQREVAMARLDRLAVDGGPHDGVVQDGVELKVAAQAVPDPGKIEGRPRDFLEAQDVRVELAGLGDVGHGDAHVRELLEETHGVLLRGAQTRGSSASRSRSPTRLMASTVARIASPGNVGSHQATLTKSRPSAIIWPQVG